eukprot:g31600.t1
MELRVESADGHTLPKNCFIGVRVGDVLKQGRYEPQRCYNFPQLDRRRNAKVDIYQHVGTCMVAVDPDTKAFQEVAVSSLDPAMPGGRIRINVQAMSEENKQQREQRTKVALALAVLLVGQARDYLMRHSIEERLSEAVKALLKEQPADPTAFLCKQLTDWDQAPGHKEAAPEGPEASELPTDESVNRLRKDARDALIKASDNGSLGAALSGQSGEATEKDQLRMRVSNLLMSSAENGELEKALAAVMKDACEDGLGSSSKENYMEQLRKKAKDTLISSMEDGSLEAALTLRQADEKDIIRMEAQQLIVSALEDGTLEKILSTNLSAADRKKILSAIEKIQAGDDKDELRIKIAELMLAAPEENLDQALAAVMKDCGVSGINQGFGGFGGEC